MIERPRDSSGNGKIIRLEREKSKGERKRAERPGRKIERRYT